MKKFLFLLVCMACTTAASCDVRIGDRVPTNPTTPIVTPTPTPTPEPAVINSFTTDNALLALNQSTTLRWSASGKCRIDPLVGDVQNTGNTPITPLFTTTYTLSCSSGGQTVARTVTVTVK